MAKLDFGRYEGISTKNVYWINPSYLKWIYENVIDCPFQIRKEIEDLFRENAPDEYEKLRDLKRWDQ